MGIDSSMATTSITRGSPPPPIPPPVKAEHGSSPPPPQPSETTTFVNEEPQQNAITKNPPKETSQNQRLLLQQEQPHFINSVSELRNLSVALSAFQRRYGELQEHLDFIQTSIDAKLLQLLDTDPSPPRPTAVVPFTKTLSSDAAKTTIVELDKSEHATDNSQSSLSEIEALCRTMCFRSLRKYIVSNLCDVTKLREEVPAALKFAPNPAKLVLESFGRFFLQGIRAYNKDSPMIPGRQASVLILEFFLLMGCNNSEIEAAVKQEAESAAVEWRKRLITEGGLDKACEVDARGLLLLIGCFGIPKTFKNDDLRDLIWASNANKISDVLRRSSVLLNRIPDIIEGMKNKMGAEAVDIAYTFGVESRFPPETIMTSFLQESKETWKRARKASQGSLVAVNKANKRNLSDLKVVIKCLEDHKIDPLKVLPGWELNEKISKLEKDIADLDKKIGEQVKSKRKADEPESSKKLKSLQEVKRTRYVDRGPELPKAAAYADGMGSSDGLTPMNMFNGGIPHFNTYSAYSSVLHGAGAGPSPIIGAGLIAAGVGAGMSAGAGDVLPTGSYAGAQSGILVDRVGQVINNSSQPYGWRGDVSFQERLVGQNYAQPATLGANGLFRSAPSMEGFVGLPNSSSIGLRSAASDLYQFADTIVESEAYAGSRAGGTIPRAASAYHSSYLY